MAEPENFLFIPVPNCKVGKPQTKFLREGERIRLGAGKEIMRGSKTILVWERGDDREDADALKKRPMAAPGIPSFIWFFKRCFENSKQRRMGK
jgi:hypothetical protein